MPGFISLPLLISTVLRVKGYTGGSFNPKNWGVNDYSDQSTDGAAYIKAKKAGEKVYMYKGQRFNTEYNGPPIEEALAYGVGGQRITKNQFDKGMHLQTFPVGSKDLLSGHSILSPRNTANYSIPRLNEIARSTIDYGPKGNMLDGLYTTQFESNKDTPRDVDLIFNANNDLLKKVSSKITSENSWNLITNNCSDATCEGLGLEKSIIQTPRSTQRKARKAYPTMNVTGRTDEDYSRMADEASTINSQINPKLSNRSNFNYAMKMSPDYTKRLQQKLSKAGYDMSHSMTKDGTFDNIPGDKTFAATQAFIKDQNSYGKTRKRRGGLLYR